MGLNESFASARAQILLMEPLPPLNEVFSLVLQEEQQREIFVLPPLIDAHAFVANSDSLRPVKTFPKKDRPICKHCGLTGHVIDKCYKLHGFPPGYKPRPQQQALANTVTLSDTSQAASPFSLTEAQYKHLLSMLPFNPQPKPTDSSHVVNTIASPHSLSVSSNNSISSWILDTGTTDHMVPSTSFFYFISSSS
ncbi:hypothetical protein I3842_06G017400 [Carya illinoinensis]|uniref:Uncharacterized protein n=1 Tax=Carya illinoinensis TaxID=32201 RepID=A0A922ENS2_CARIL|nr:hypothetical protein I3842_06G017400 [Carya illinoinensis]